jgi:rhodanese-related sulfurtransferase
MRLQSFLQWLPVGKVPEITPQEFHQWLLENRSLQVVDARTLPEYQSGTIGRAQHAPLTEMPVSMERLALHTNQPVVVLCLSGHRSLPGVRWLRQHGFEAYSLQGGILNWKRQGYNN